jgi:hypothetical protein
MLFAEKCKKFEGLGRPAKNIPNGHKKYKSTPKREKIYKHTKTGKNIPNDHKIPTPTFFIPRPSTL